MVRSSGVVVARNSLYNFLTQVAVSFVAFVSIPFIVRRMGEEAFGLLTLIWMVVGYLSVLDFGVGQASVKYLAEQIGRGDIQKANSIVGVSVLVSFGLGLLASCFMLLMVPLFLDHVFEVPVSLYPVALSSLQWITLAIPFIMVQGAFRAVPMALQRFDLLNLVQGAGGLLQWGGSLALIVTGHGLFEVVMLTVGIRFAGAILSYAVAASLFPNLSIRRISFAKDTVKQLIRFGGWLTISQAVSPIVRYLDRLFVASYQSMRMFTFYSVPYEAVGRLQVIPLSLSTTLLPAMSERDALSEEEGGTVHILYERGLNLVVIVLLPVSIVLGVFSHQILELWLGGDFPAHSSGVLTILAAAVFVQAVGYVPVTALQAIGKPDIATKFYLGEIPLYFLLCMTLIPQYGIDGAALAWLIRLLIIVPALMYVTHKLILKRSGGTAYGFLVRGAVVNVALLAVLLASRLYFSDILSTVTILCAAVACYSIAVWHFCVDAKDKSILKTVFKRST